MQAAVRSNLKVVSLEVDGKSTIVFEDSDIDEAIKTSTYSITWS
jgi:acyl-CoA reductase-like NAD-dependent aldehyde dehydrogenase